MFHWVADRVLDSYFDKRFGIVSSKRRRLEELGFTSPYFEDYQPLSYLDLRDLFGHLSIKPSDVFLDYGCGMGRPLCVAATYPFHRVIGVELSSELCRVANENLQAVGQRVRCSDVAVLNANALEYDLPEDVNLILFFNPFGGEVLRGVLGKIGESLRESPRKIRLIFCGTDSCTRFREEAQRHPWLILESERTLKTGVKALHYGNHL